MNNQNDENSIIEERITKVNGDFHIKRYARGKLLGKGGFAKVYKFTNLENNKVMAGKIMPKANLNRSRSRQKLMVEIRLHQSLRHPHIVKFEHVFEDQDNVYILLELCDNQSMNELFKRRKRLTEFEVQCYVVQIIDALKYLHSNRIIHRDLKLGNLFLSDKMEVKLGDFGLAAKLEFDGEKKRTVCGTPNYIAPEILDGNIGHSYEVDNWSLGVIIYTLIIGKPPFETTDIKLTYKKIKENDFSFPSNVQISDNAKDLIKKILLTQPEKRLTLDEILQHPFINNGGPVPKLMPVSTLACPPTSAYIKQFASSSTSQRIRISTDPENFETQDFFKGGKCNTTRGTPMLKSPNAFDAPTIDLFRMTPKTPQTEFFGSDRFNPLAVLDQNKMRPSIFPTPKIAKKNYLNTEGIEEVKEEHLKLDDEQPKQSKQSTQIETPLTSAQEITDLRIIKWYDYSAKYGLAYLLSNGSVGVYFNDGVKLIATSDETFDLIVRSADKQESINSYKFNDCPQEVQKKVLVYKRFKEYFDPIIKTLTKQENQENHAYVKKWIRTKQAILFRLSSKLLQVIFKDESMVLMNADTKKLTFVDAKGAISGCTLEQAMTTGNKELTKRVKYTEEVLRHIWSAQTVPEKPQKEEEEKEAEKVESAGIDIHGIDLNKNIYENPIEAVMATTEAATTPS